MTGQQAWVSGYSLCIVRDTAQFGMSMCVCVCVEAGRMPEAGYWCFHTCHRSSDPHQHNDWGVNSLGVAWRWERRDEKKCGEEADTAGHGYTVCSNSYSSCNTE